MDTRKENLFIMNHNLTEDTKICRYMGFDVFLQLLYGKLYVPRRMKFLDVRESGQVPLRNYFALRAVGETHVKPLTDVNAEQKRINSLIANLKKSRFLLTSCWTIDNGEDYLMWKSYATQIGVCVKTTIGQLLSNINYEKFNLLPICSTMSYLSIYQKAGFLESVFAKDKHYQSENEFRIYFVPIDNTTEEEMKSIDTEIVERILSKSSEKEEEQSENPNYQTSIFLDIDPQFINSIVLSPFIKSSTIDCFQDIIYRQFSHVLQKNVSIDKSRITEE